MIAKPNKEKVRKWFREHVKSKEPPPSQEEIRRSLGWYLFPKVSK